MNYDCLRQVMSDDWLCQVISCLAATLALWSNYIITKAVGFLITFAVRQNHNSKLITPSRRGFYEKSGGFFCNILQSIIKNAIIQARWFYEKKY